MGVGQRILVADDDPEIRRLLSRALEKRYEVITAADGAEALAVLERTPVAAVICDQRMPERTGIEVLSAAGLLQPTAARIIVTASAGLDAARDAVNLARVHRFLVKPLRLAEIESSVAGAIHEVELMHENALLVRELKHANDHLEQMVALRTEELEQALSALSELAVHDGLTGLYNHRFFQESLGKMLARADRNDAPVGLIFLDVDHFKHYNDQLGHLAGDEVLRTVGRIITGLGTETGHGRAADVAARYGGEEFVIALPDTDRGGATVLAERLRARIESHDFTREEVQPGGQLTVSIGVASFPEDAATKEGLIDAADRALYRAKHQGRNRVCHAEGQGRGGGPAAAGLLA